MASKKVKEHYDKNAEGNWVCKHCRQVLAKGTSLTRLKFHLSGEEGRGVRICKDVPPEVKQADYLSVESNKRQKTMPPHQVDVGVLRGTIPSSSREQPSHFDNGGRMMLEPDLGQPVEEIVAPKLTQGDALLTTNLVGEDFEMYMDEIWTWLLDDDVTRIGIWGMAGVGKTALAKHVHNELLQIPNQFDHVYWVTVSPDFTVHKLQDSFGKSLGLDLSNEEDEHKRAAKLSKALNGSGGAQACLVAEAITTISLFYIPTFQETRFGPVLKYISALYGSLWAIFLVFAALSRPLGWTLLILWCAEVAWHAKDFGLCCREFYAELVSGAVTRDQQVHGHDDQQNYSCSATKFQVSVALGIITCLLAYLQIKSQTSLFKTAPLAMHSSLVLAAIAAISLFHLPLVILNGYYYQVLGYVSVFSTSLWMVLLVFALSPPLAWGFLVVWGIFVAWYAKDFYLCCRDICAELVRAVRVSDDQGVHEGDGV